MTAFTLKLIAFLTMLIDHATACLVDVARIGNVSNTLYFTLRGIGRIAFPIFCFLIVEGAVHTKSKWRYALRILIFAFISEIPFDVALFGSFIKLSAQNVDFTLLIGLGVVFYMIWAAGWKGKWCYFGLGLTVLIMGGGMLLARFLKTDYSMGGVVQITIMGVLALPRDKFFRGLSGTRWFRGIVVAAAIIACCIVLRNSFELVALVSIPLIVAYNGKRGLKTPFTKWGGYLFYPVHLALLGLIFVVPKLI